MNPALIALALAGVNLNPGGNPIKPCACGSKKTGWLWTRYPDNTVRVQCDDCKLCGPTAETKEEAARLWNIERDAENTEGRR